MNFLGTDGADSFTLALGTNTYTGGAGADTYGFSSRGGQFNTITDFDTAEDVIDLSSRDIGSFDGLLRVARQVGDDVQIRLLWDGELEVIVLQDRLLADLDAANFTFSGSAQAIDTGTTGNDILYLSVTEGDLAADRGNDTIIIDSLGDFGRTLTALGGAGNDRYVGPDTFFGTVEFNGGSGDDVAIGGDADEFLFGGDGNDTLSGGGGRDTFRGGDGNDRIYGGADTDTIRAGNGNDAIRGGSEGDLIYGEDGNDLINGDGGVDIIYGGEGIDTVIGGEGGDILYGGTFAENDLDDSADFLSGGAGSDTLYGGGGDDRMFGGTGFDEMNGGDGNDALVGGAEDDVLNGDAGDDSLRGDAGADTLNGGAGNDRLYGGADNDMLDGGAGDDAIIGGDGADTITGGAGTNSVRGDAGADVFYNTAGGTDVVHQFVSGEDRVRIDTVAQIDISGCATQDGDDVVVDTDGTAGSSTVVLFDTQLSDLSLSDFEFTGNPGGLSSIPKPGPGVAIAETGGGAADAVGLGPELAFTDDVLAGAVEDWADLMMADMFL